MIAKPMEQSHQRRDDDDQYVGTYLITACRRPGDVDLSLFQRRRSMMHQLSYLPV